MLKGKIKEWQSLLIYFCLILLTMLVLWAGREAVLHVLPASDVTDMERRNPDVGVLRPLAAVDVKDGE